MTVSMLIVCKHKLYCVYMYEMFTCHFNKTNLVKTLISSEKRVETFSAVQPFSSVKFI